jgi:hypothetical protein
MKHYHQKKSIFLNKSLTTVTKCCIRILFDQKGIQIRPFEVQLGEDYKCAEGVDFLLVVNNRTQYDEVEAWRRQLVKIGGR